jgi:putative hydrolase of the HAD superfamily
MCKDDLARVRAIGLDADDTLWHNESLYSGTQEKFRALLTRYTPAEVVDQSLYATEMRNLQHFGYGIKGFTLSMIETAIELTGGQIRGHEIQQIIEMAKGMLQAPVDLLPDVQEVVARLAEEYSLLLITKGDLFDQESKVARSGLADYFDHVEVVSDKRPANYRSVLDKRGLKAAEFLMVGNSLRSDVLPVLELGGYAVYIPYAITWQHEVVEEPAGLGYFQLPAIRELPAFLAEQRNGG